MGLFFSIGKFILDEKIHFLGNLHFNETNTMVPIGLATSPYVYANHSELF
jgi:hypothetical protein